MEYKLGIKPNGEIKDTLSYSGWKLWKSSKDAYRKRYYENIKPFETPETIFGHQMARTLEEDSSIVGSEYEIRVTLKEGLKLLSYLDSFDEATLSITEFNSGHLDPKGNAPWSNLKVAKHKQLDFYSMMVKEKFGKVNPKVTLKWYETEFAKETREFQGHILEGTTKKLRLTGREETFTRSISEWERKKIREEVLLAAEEITKDYEEYSSRSK